jgi:hypothetical protein
MLTESAVPMKYEPLLAVPTMGHRLISTFYTIEELLARKRSGSGLEIREYGRRDQSR